MAMMSGSPPYGRKPPSVRMLAADGTGVWCMVYGVEYFGVLIDWPLGGS